MSDCDSEFLSECRQTTDVDIPVIDASTSVPDSVLDCISAFLGSGRSLGLYGGVGYNSLFRVAHHFMVVDASYHAPNGIKSTELNARNIRTQGQSAHCG